MPTSSVRSDTNIKHDNAVATDQQSFENYLPQPDHISPPAHMQPAHSEAKNFSPRGKRLLIGWEGMLAVMGTTALIVSSLGLHYTLTPKENDEDEKDKKIPSTAPEIKIIPLLLGQQQSRKQ